MSSKLYIDELPYGSDIEVAWYDKCNMQFTYGTEIILTIEELEILLKAKFLNRTLIYRANNEYINDAKYILEHKENLISDEGDTIIDLFELIRKELGYFGANIDFEKQELSQTISILENANNKFGESLSNNDEIIKGFMDWANNNFIEGKHYFYTI